MVLLNPLLNPVVHHTPRSQKDLSHPCMNYLRATPFGGSLRLLGEITGLPPELLLPPGEVSCMRPGESRPTAAAAAAAPAPVGDGVAGRGAGGGAYRYWPCPE